VADPLRWMTLTDIRVAKEVIAQYDLTPKEAEAALVRVAEFVRNGPYQPYSRAAYTYAHAVSAEIQRNRLPKPTMTCEELMELTRGGNHYG